MVCRAFHAESRRSQQRREDLKTPPAIPTPYTSYGKNTLARWSAFQLVRFRALDVLDIDARHGGGSWLAENKHRLPPTRVHRTRSGGLHLFLQHQQGMRCSAGRIAAGVDVRATGGYVIWWPAAGLPVLSDIAPVAWPGWLCTQLMPRQQSRHRRVVVADQYVLKRLIQVIAGASEGERNSLTYWAACRAGEMVASGLLAADVAAAVIAEAATRAGLPRAEAERTARNGVRTNGGVGRV